MTSKIKFAQEYYVYAEDGTPTPVKYYDLYDRGNPILRDVTLVEINKFLALDHVHEFYADLDPREYTREVHPTDGTCWCGQTAVAHIASVDPTDGVEFHMPRCLSCLLGQHDVEIHPDN